MKQVGDTCLLVDVSIRALLSEMFVFLKPSLPKPWLYCAVGQQNDIRGCFPLSLALAEKDQSLVDKNSDQPASESAFKFKARRIARCNLPAIMYSNLCSLLFAQYSASDEVK
jgi:hypothetical protein